MPDSTHPSREDVLDALHRLAASEVFGRSDRLNRFLRFVVERTLDGRSAELKEYLIGAEVYEKGADFDPRLDSSVRVDARRLRAKLAEYYAGEGAPEQVRIILPKGAYVPEFAFSKTEDAPAEIEKTAEPEVESPRKRIQVASAVLGLAVVALLGWWAWTKWGSPPAADGQHVVRALAVLPFTNMTGHAEYESLCDGLAEELTNRVARIRSIRVVSKTSAFAFKGKQADVRRVAETLQVDSIIEGSVREGRDNLRITVQLIRARDGSHVWSESFDFTKGDDLDLQAHIGQTVERLLAGTLPADANFTPEVSEEDQRVNSLVVQASHLAQRRTEDALLKAIDYAGQALKSRPSNASAWATLAEARLSLANIRPPADRTALVSESRAAANKAAELNPGLAGPLATLGAIRLLYEWNWRDAEGLFRKALSLNPNHAIARARYAQLLTLESRHSEAVEQARQAELLAPVSVTSMAMLAHAFLYARQFEQAAGQLRKAVEIDPGYDIGRITLARVLVFMGHLAEAQKEAGLVSSSGQQLGEFATLSAVIQAKLGNHPAAKKTLERSERSSVISVATAWAFLGDREQVFRILTQAIKTKEPDLVYLAVSPGLDSVRDDPRLQPICRQVGLKSCQGRP